MQKTKALIFDVDGTAVNSPDQKIPTKRLHDAIRAVEDKYYVCAATGRPWPFAKIVLKALGLVDHCIISGGTQICLPTTGEIIWQCNIESADVLAVKNILLKYPKYGFVANDFTEDDYYSKGLPVAELDASQDVFVIGYIYMPEAMAKKIADELRTIKGIACVIGNSHNNSEKDVHITNRAATKEHAVAELLKLINVKTKNTYGFGDALNDINLFRAVNTKVAMGNAEPELKAAADEVIDTVANDGLAKYFENLASKNKAQASQT